MPELIIALSVGALLCALIVVLVVRAILFKPTEANLPSSEKVTPDGERVVYTLAEMIKCKTVSDVDKSNEDEEEFLKFKALLPKLFPKVYEVCTYEEPSDRAILFKWKGEDSSHPTVLMAHYDVVSVVEEQWEKPAFDAIIENGVLWGRGAIDTKATLNGVLSAANELIENGFVPKNDIYFAFGGDEEVNGHGAKDIVELFKNRGILPGLVLDEGGAVVENVFPGVKKPCALIGTAEKGMLNVKYSVTGGGGHSSSPAAHTPVGVLSAACVRVEKKPFKFRITRPARQMFNALARHSTFVYRLIFANLWFFSPVLNLITSLGGGELNALVRTTTAFTQMEGSKGMNVIPPFASMVSNHRIIPGETMDSVLERIKKTVNDERVEISVISGMNPSRVSDVTSEAYERVETAVRDTWTDAIVSPYLMLACSDSRHWGEISDKVFRFSAMALTKEERATIHGNNERIHVEKIVQTAEFYIRLMKNS